MDSALVILRLVGGLLVAGHGAQKLFGWVGGHGIKGAAGGGGAAGVPAAAVLGDGGGSGGVRRGSAAGTGTLQPAGHHRHRRIDDDGDRQGALAEDLGERRRGGTTRRLSVRGSRGGDHGPR